MILTLDNILKKLDELIKIFTDNWEYKDEPKDKDKIILMTGVDEHIEIKMLTEKMFHLNNVNRDRILKCMNTSAFKKYLLYLTLECGGNTSFGSVEFDEEFDEDISSIAPEDIFTEFNTDENYVVIVEPCFTELEFEDIIENPVKAKINLIDMKKQQLQSIMVLLLIGDSKNTKTLEPKDKHIN